MQKSLGASSTNRVAAALVLALGGCGVGSLTDLGAGSVDGGGSGPEADSGSGSGEDSGASADASIDTDGNLAADAAAGADAGDPPAPLEDSGAVHETLSAGETYAVSGKRFRDIAGGVIALDISGPGPTSGTTVEIADNLFTNCAYAIHIENIENVIIRGNRFEDVGNAVRLQNCHNHTVEYNEVDRLGVYDTNGDYGSGGWWACNAVSVMGNTVPGVVEINHNIVDNSSLDGFSVNYTEDFINVNHSAASSTGHIRGNKVRGHATSGSSSGGGVILDQSSDNYAIEDNICVNTAQYGIGSANSANVRIADNQVFLSWQHDAGLTDHPYNSGSNVVGMIASTYGDGYCGVVVFENNWAVAQRANASGTAYEYDFNFWNGGCASGNLTFTDNNFTEGSSNDGPNQPPAGFDESILPADLFDGLDESYFSGRRTDW